jgi:hypothetical protein
MPAVRARMRRTTRLNRAHADYRVYGLGLRTSIPLPHAIAGDGSAAPDVHFELGRLPRGGDSPTADFSNELGRLSFALDPRGTRVWAEYSEETAVRSPDDVAALLLGPVLRAVLRRRGRIGLHGCVIEMGSGAVALLGNVGAGKSTLAGALAQKGHAVLSDDIVAVSPDGLVHPGYPRLRMAPLTLASLYPGAPVGGAVATGFEKRYVELSTAGDHGAWRFQPEPRPLAAIYLLERGGAPAPRIDELAGAERFLALASHLREPYGPLPRDTRAEEHRRLGALSERVPIRRLRYPDAFDGLAATCEMLLALSG